MIRLPIVLCLLFFPFVLLAESIQGLVVGVSDGDTITLLTDSKQQLKIRLASIDAPENGQAFESVSKRALSALVFKKRIRADITSKDRYGRSIAVLYSDGERNINREMVRSGLAWWYRKYASGDSVLERLEREARMERRGLWQDANPVPPWDYRRGVGVVDSNSEAGGIIGNKNSRIYHWPGCPSYSKVSPKNRKYFKNRADAENAGFRAARNCN